MIFGNLELSTRLKKQVLLIKEEECFEFLLLVNIIRSCNAASTLYSDEKEP